MLHDLHYAVRLLVKSPSFTAVALATLAVGSAATAAIFSVVNGLLLRPLPYPEPGRLVMLWQDQRARGGPEDEWLAPAHFFDWRGRSRSLETSAVFRGASPALTGQGEQEQLRVEAAWIAATGVGLGALAAFGAARVIRTLLFGVSASDASTFAMTAALLGAIALVAGYLPARRAVRVDPVRALRTE
jgi:hypothetical protein